MGIGKLICPMDLKQDSDLGASTHGEGRSEMWGGKQGC